MEDVAYDGDAQSFQIFFMTQDGEGIEQTLRRMFVQAVAHRDYTLLQALVMLVAGMFIFVNFLMDVAYAWIDPRIRYR